MKTYIVAGHEFPDAVDACCIKPKPNGDRCTMTWAVLETATRDDIGKPEMSHVPNFTTNEYDEVQAEKKRREEQRERAYSATMDLGSGA